MIIKHHDGNSVDTDKLPDIDAMIYEKIQELKKICEDNHRPFVLFANACGDNAHFDIFWQFSSKNNFKKNGFDIWPIASMMGKYVETLTNGTITMQLK
jgi:hypothetical protein